MERIQRYPYYPNCSALDLVSSRHVLSMPNTNFTRVRSPKSGSGHIRRCRSLRKHDKQFILALLFDQLTKPFLPSGGDQRPRFSPEEDSATAFAGASDLAAIYDLDLQRVGRVYFLSVLSRMETPFDESQLLGCEETPGDIVNTARAKHFTLSKETRTLPCIVC